MDLAQAITVHLDWKLNLRSAAGNQGKLAADSVADMFNARQYAETTKALDAGSSYTAASSAVGVAIKAMQRIAG